MNYTYSYVQTSAAILRAFSHQEPFAEFLKKFFRQHKKFGSRDRKQISHLCYCYFRKGKAFQNKSFEEQIAVGLFLCEKTKNEILEKLNPQLNLNIEKQTDEKLYNLKLSIDEIFLTNEALSLPLKKEQYVYSMFQQPDLFIRARPDKDKYVEQKLLSEGVYYNKLNSYCFALNNGTKVDDIIELDRDAVIQDYSSQQTANFFKEIKNHFKENKIKVWDCCAASGGKSILAIDNLPISELIVSDNRKSILHNCDKRLLRAGIKPNQSFCLDLTKPIIEQTSDFVSKKYFDLIIADVPCSGSGTWSRTPESFYYFNTETIINFSQKQIKILNQIIPYIKPGGCLLYITCSVFKKENEEIVAFIQNQFSLQLQTQKLIMGIENKADNLFGALFIKK